MQFSHTDVMRVFTQRHSVVMRITTERKFSCHKQGRLRSQPVTYTVKVVLYNVGNMYIANSAR